MILITGGTGYIGSHTAVVMMNAGHEVLIVDNLCNSDKNVIGRIEKITGKRPHFIHGDIRDKALWARVFADYRIGAVLHFAGLKAVGESNTLPLEYYDNNINGTLCLLSAMKGAGVRNIVFSSSATVYGDPASVPIREDFPIHATNPYGRTKAMIEEILADLYQADINSSAPWKVGRLRYFNPVGAHGSGMIGEDPRGVPNNLMPFVAQVADGRREALSVWGNDYPTPDGTGVRDYIHVMDLAEGHRAALDYLMKAQSAGETGKGELLTVNLGTGRGYSVLEMVRAFEKACGKPIPIRIAGRRAGDIATCYADPSYARRTLGWQAQLDLDAMCQSAWNWQKWRAENVG